jgi:hypothetical protein
VHHLAVGVAQRLEDRLDVGDAVAAMVILLPHAELLEPAQHEVVAAIAGPVRVSDEPGAADLVDVRPPFVVPLPPRPQQHHSDNPIAIERVRHHVAVPRLEDVQRQAHIRKQHHIGQRKQRQGGGKHAPFQCTVHVFLSM